jgi:hypothetical protein
LKEYWNTDVQMEKSKKMAMARGSVKTLSIVGQKGKDRKEEEVSLTTKVCTPTQTAKDSSSDKIGTRKIAAM